MTFKSLKVQIIVSITGIVAFSFAITGLFFYNKLKKELSQAINKNAFNVLNATCNQVETQHRSILYHKSVVLNRRKIELKNKVILAHSVIHHNYNIFKQGLMTEEKAKRESIKVIKEMRYDEGVGYFWLNDLLRPFPRMIMHTTIPELDGKILDDPKFNCALGRQENLFKAFVDVCIANKEGYVDYLWPKPTPEGLTEKQPKVSYVKLFEPWGWVIGSGVYIDDIDKDVQARIDAVIEELNDTIAKQRIGESGYFFIFDADHRMLVHPTLKGTDGSILINPGTQNSLLKDFQLAAHSESKTMKYFWDKPLDKGNYIYSKTAFLAHFEPLDWYICSSVYKEDFEDIISKFTRSIIISIILILLIIINVSLLVSKNITTPLNMLIHSIKRTDKDGIPIKPIAASNITEIALLSMTINKMINSIRVSRNALKLSESKFRGLVESSSDSIWECNQTGVFLYMSPMVEKILGYSPEEVIGKSVFDLMNRKESLRISKIFNNIIEKKKSYFTLEHILYHKDGHEVVIETNGVPVKDENDNVLGFRGIDRDITSRKDVEKTLKEKTLELSQAYEELKIHKENLEELVNERTIELQKILENLRRTQSRLIQSEKMAALGELVAGVAHEINTPVGVGVTAASYLEDNTNQILKTYKTGKLSKKDFEVFLNRAAESSGIILSNMNRAADLIQSFKKITVDQSSEEFRPFNIKEYINEILLSLFPKFKRTKHRVTVDCPHEFLIHSYPGAFSQIITNLIMNSLIHGFENTEEGIISIQIEKKDDTIYLTYSDNGDGISEEIREKIFDPFFTTKRGQGGSGLGMHLVFNQVIQTLQGSIHCKDNPNGGALFELEFPCHLEASEK